MPNVPRDPNELGLIAPMGEPLPPEPTYEASLVGSAFLQENSLVSTLARLREKTFPPEPDHHPFPLIKGTNYEADFLDEFVGSRSEAETRQIMGRIDKEMERRAQLESAGAAGMAAAAVAGMLDPTVLLPGGAVVRGVRGGYRVMRTAVGSAALGTLSAAASEAALHASQGTRTWGESVVNISSATLLSGLIGGGAAALLTKAERASMTKAIEETRLDIRSGGQSVGAAAADQRKLILRDFTGPIGRSLDTAAEAAEKLPYVGRAVAGTLRFPEAMYKISSPTMTVFSSPFLTGRRLGADLMETVLEFEDHAKGIPTTYGVPIDRHVDTVKHRVLVRLMDRLDELWKDYYFSGGAAERAPKLRADIRRMTGGDPDGRMTYGEFKEAVARAAREDDSHPIPQVAAAAKANREIVDEPLKKKAQELGLFGEEMGSPAGDSSHLLRAFNKEAIRRNPNEFVRRVAAWYRSDQAKKAAAQERLKASWDLLKKERGAQKKLASKADAAPEQMIVIEDRIADIRGRMEAEILAWGGKSALEGKWAIKAREKQAPRQDGKRREGADDAVDMVVKRIIESRRDLNEQELLSRARETMERILAVPDGRLPYDIETPDPKFSGRNDTGPRRGSLISRQFAIPSRDIEEFLVNDVEELARRSLNSLVPDLLLIERFGHVELEPQFKALQEEISTQAMAAKTPEEAAAIRREGERVENVLRAVTARIRGTYGYSTSPMVRNLGRMANVARNFNVLTDMGGGLISQFPDMAGAVFRYGFTHAFRHAWNPLFKKVLGLDKGGVFDSQKEAVRALGIGVETALHTRAQSLHDIAYETGDLSRFERGMSSAAANFFRINGMAPVTDAMKVAASAAASNSILKSARAVAEGAATERQIRDLAGNNIDPIMAAEIWRNANTPDGLNDFDGILVPNTESWSNKQAALQFEAAVARETDLAIVTPGQEKPLWLSHPIAGLLGQFKSFVASANERILLTNLQRRDARTLSGLITSVTMGMLGYTLYSLASGRTLSDRPQDWIKEGIDRSGVLGWLSEVNALTAKASRGSIDLYRLVGADKPLSRYASRSVAGAFLGPTFGKVESLTELAGSTSTGEWTAGDTRRLRRLAAGQNLFYLRWMLDQVEKEGNALFGVPEKNP